MLAPVRLPSDPRVLVSASTADDAGVVQIRDDLALVHTVDFFPPVVDDPTWYGRIAAANSISDVYAMGGEPVSAVSVFAIPPDIPDDIPAAILTGAVEVCEAAGAPLVGGHTVKDVEIKFGLAVNGTVHPQRVITNAHARAGDVLVLSKPLGSGFLSTAIRAGALDESTTLRVMEVMAELNRGAGEAMVEVGVHAATDITGFGLLGHGLELAEAAGLSIRIEAAAVPWIEGLAPFLRKEYVCGGLHRNREYAEQGRVRWTGGTPEQHLAIADPQTSGGLLIAVAPEKLEALLSAMEARGVGTRAVIGQIVPRTDVALEIV